MGKSDLLEARLQKDYGIENCPQPSMMRGRMAILKAIKNFL
jgi:hypothetical protein